MTKSILDDKEHLLSHGEPEDAEDYLQGLDQHLPRPQEDGTTSPRI